jgi:hypothetical protein
MGIIAMGRMISLGSVWVVDGFGQRAQFCLI